MKPLISIIIPVYNREKTLELLFDSLLRIDYENVEIVLVDNASTDDSYSMCLNFALRKKHNGFCISVLSELRRGASAARNCGLKHCKGEIVAFFDSDDEISSDFLSRMQQVMESKDCDFVLATTNMIMPNGRVKRRESIRHHTVADQILSTMISTQSFLAKTDFIRKIGGWNESLPRWNDYELGVRMLLATDSIEWIPEAFHKIYQHQDSITGKSLSSSLADIVAAFKAIEHDIEGCDGKVVRALFFREQIVAGDYAKNHLYEGEGVIDDMSKALIYSRFSSKIVWFLLLLLGRTLKFYHRCGGKGAWRIALYLI